jgi:glucosylceramidase
MSRGALVGVSAGVANLLDGRKSYAQFPKSQPLHDERITFVTTAESNPWQDAPVFSPTFTFTMLNLNLESPAPDATPMQGFGACFNELGWTSLQTMSEADRDAVMSELFDPTAGARFTYCRMPVGANDFATDA